MLSTMLGVVIAGAGGFLIACILPFPWYIPAAFAWGGLVGLFQAWMIDVG